MIRDFIMQSCNNPGVGTTCTLIAAPAGRLAFSAKFTTGAAAFYYLDDGTQFECGYGTLTTGSPDTFSRDTVLSNSAGTTVKLNFTGTTRIYNEVPASSVIYMDKFGITSTGLLSVLEPATGTQSILLTSTGANGANIKMVGNGATTPNKYIRVLSGNFQIINSSYTAVPFNMSDAGALGITGILSATGMALSGAATGTSLTLSSSLTAAAISGTGVTVTAASVGKIALVQGDASHTGYVSFQNASSVQQGYIGYAPASSWILMNTVGTAIGFAVNTALSVGTNLTVAGTMTSTGAMSCGQGSYVNFSNTTGLSVNQTGATAATGIVVNLANISSFFAIYQYGGSTVGSISTNGSATSYNTASDARLKLHAGSIEHAGQIIDALEPLWYRWKAQPEGERQPGFFAQQVRDVFPHAVSDGRGEPGDENFVPVQMDQSKMMPLVIAELKALRSRVAELEARTPA